MHSKFRVKRLHKLADAYIKGHMRVNREYQRGLTWTIPQKQGLIDSLLRGYEIPVFYFHVEECMNEFSGKLETTVWIVDGQQRLSAIVQYLNNEFALPDQSKPGTMVPVTPDKVPPWSGKKFQELSDALKTHLQERKLWFVELKAGKDQVRELFIRLQAGTPLTAQQKRDAWPGDFSLFVIQYAGKPQHPQGDSPHVFFDLFKKQSKRIVISDDTHYVDKRADTRKFCAQLAMTIICRERHDCDFVDLNGSTINDFYLKNLTIEKHDTGRERFINLLDTLASLPKFNSLRDGPGINFTNAFHLAVLVDSLDQGNYVLTWKDSVVDVFVDFLRKVAESRRKLKDTGEQDDYYSLFASQLTGAGSDKVDAIRRRHAFLISKIHEALKITTKDQKRCFDLMEREIIWNRDKGKCQNPKCERADRKIAFWESQIHHIVEHSSGGQTVLKNGILVCPECHANRYAMQELTEYFKEYIEKIYNESSIILRPPPPPTDQELQITINWEELDIEHPASMIHMENDNGTIVETLRLLIQEFDEDIIEQMMNNKIVRFALSKNPDQDFMNQSTGKPYSYIKIPKTDLYFCGQSTRDEKRKRLRVFFANLTLPNGSYFPESAIEIK